MKQELISIDELTGYCGYFTSETDANNGYGCNHPEQKEFETVYKDEEGYTHRGFDDDISKPKVKQGKCYSSSCPFGYSCEVRDLKKLKSDMLADYADDPDDWPVDDYVVCQDEEIIKKIRNEG